MKKILFFVLIALGVVNAVPAQAANLVTNGGFETGDFSGWTLSGTDSSPSLNGIYYGVDDVDANTGAYGAFFGPVGGVLTLAQTLATTPGAGYTITFALRQDTDPSPGYLNSLSVQLGTSTAYSATNIPAEDYTLYTVYGSSSSSASPLRFNLRNDGGYFSLDDVSVTAGTPEPASFLLVTPALAAAFLLRRRLTSK